MTDRALGIALVVIFLLAGIAVKASRTEHDAERVQAQQGPQKTIGYQDSYKEVAPQTKPSSALHGDSKANGEHSEENGTEFWPAFFGYRFKVTDSLLVLFTAILAWKTAGLDAATRKLWEAGERQISIGQRAADAALLSARAAESALEGSDAPFMSVIPEINAVKQKLVGGAIVLQFMQGSRLIKYSLVNYGKSPAFVLEMYRTVTVANRIPGHIEFPPPQTNLFKVEIVGPDRETPKYYIDKSEIDRAGGGNLRWADGDFSDIALWLSIQIRYRDALGAQFVSGHTFGFNAFLAEFYAHGGTGHNYRRKLTDNERAAMELRDAL